jgi:hypothetical protein
MHVVLKLFIKWFSWPDSFFRTLPCWQIIENFLKKQAPSSFATPAGQPYPCGGPILFTGIFVKGS